MLIFLKKDFYLFIWQRERERSESEHKQTEWQAGGEAGSLPSKEPDVGTRSQDAGIMTWAEGSRSTNWATQASLNLHFLICEMEKFLPSDNKL